MECSIQRGDSRGYCFSNKNNLLKNFVENRKSAIVKNVWYFCTLESAIVFSYGQKYATFEYTRTSYCVSED